MKLLRLKRGILVSLSAAVFLLFGVFAGPVPAQQGPGDDGPHPIDAGLRAKVIDSVAAALNKTYVFPETARDMEKLMRRKLKKKEYDTLDTYDAFTRQLTEDMRSVSHDLHLWVQPFWELPAERTDTLTDKEQEEQALEQARYRNFGFEKIERLPGNIGYIDLRGFADAKYGGPTAIAAMQMMAYCDGVIIDLRRNGGGSPSMIQLLSSYFFDETVHLNSFYIRETDSIQQFWTQANVPGPKLVDKPLYLLTSDYTFSAAEEFTYNMKNLERAFIVGDTTGGGAHPVNMKIFYDIHIRLKLPFGRAINPISGTNWEGTGITPHLVVPSDQALDVAHKGLLDTLLQTVDHPLKRQVIEWTRDGLAARINPVKVTARQMKEYSGTFGPRVITVEDGKLYYQRNENPHYQLIPMAKDMFMIEELDYFRVKFERDKTGKVVKIIGLYDNGHTDEHERSI